MAKVELRINGAACICAGCYYRLWYGLLSLKGSPWSLVSTRPWNGGVYLVGDGSYSTYGLMGKAAEQGIGLITRMRIDARLFHFPSTPPAGKRGPKPKLGDRILPMDKRLDDRRTKCKIRYLQQLLAQAVA